MQAQKKPSNAGKTKRLRCVRGSLVVGVATRDQLAGLTGLQQMQLLLDIRAPAHTTDPETLIFGK